MKTVEDLRPEVIQPDPDWSARTLRAILAEPRGARGPRLALVGKPRQRVRFAIGVAAAAAVLTAVGLIGPFGSPGPSAAAAQLTAAHLSVHPEVGADEFLHIKRVERDWGYGGAGAEDDRNTLEYWVPGDGTSEWIERSGRAGRLETHSFADWGPQLYVHHSSQPARLLEELRKYAASQGESADLHGVWTVAFWIANDPVAPQTLKDEVMKAISTVDGVRVADPDFDASGLSGRALTMGGKYEVWFVVDPNTSAFRGMVGHPERDKSWVGPQAPMWTVVFESSVAAEAPEPTS
jgi:hypothetical protein